MIVDLTLFTWISYVSQLNFVLLFVLNFYEKETKILLGNKVYVCYHLCAHHR